MGTALAGIPECPCDEAVKPGGAATACAAPFPSGAGSGVAKTVCALPPL